MGEIVPFDYEGQPIRTSEINGEPIVMAADVCRILGVADVSMAMTRLDDDEKLQVRGNTSSTGVGGRDPWWVTEAGLYSLILGSRKPETRTFKRFVTHDLLPQVRKTGVYGVSHLSRRELLVLALAAEDERDAEAARADKAEAQVAELEPRAALADAIAVTAENGGDSFSVGEAAKFLRNDPSIKISPQRLFDKMQEWRLVFRRDGHLIPYQDRIHQGLLIIKPYSTLVNPQTGTEIYRTPQVRLTFKGLMFLHKKLGCTVPLRELVEQSAVGQGELDFG